jgi:MIP family channel proteins
MNFVMRRDDWRKYCCEFIGTFSLVFFAAGAVMIGSKTGDLGAIGGGVISGLIVTIVIYTFGHISGAHVNPALTITAAIMGKFKKRLVLGYIIAQMAGSGAAGYFLLWCIGPVAEMGANLPNLALGVKPGVAFAIELFLSFFLMWVICGCAFHRMAHSKIAGVVIGAVVGIEVMLMAPYAGAAMNPARAFGPYLARADFTYYWIYVIGPIVGMVAGGLTYKFTHK